MAEPESGTFDVSAFADELASPSVNVGTTLLFENDRVKVWEIRLEPGQRAPFHRHPHPYFFVCAEPGRVRTRFANGFYADGDAEPGEFMYLEHSEDEPGIHDLENIGDTTVRYTTVELLG
jgi:hypothetical protein